MSSVGVINKFNDSVRIDKVYERVTGNKVKAKNCKCPFHNSGNHNNNNAGVNIQQNCFSCFSHRCVTSFKPYEFIAKYHGLENEKFIIIAKKVNEYYPNSFKIYSKDNEEFLKEKNDYVLSNFYYKIEEDITVEIRKRIDLLNNFFLNKQGINSDIIKMNQLWNYVKVNEFYYTVAEYIKIDEIGFKIDEEKLNNEIINRVLKFKNKCYNLDKMVKKIIEVGKKIADKYKKNPSNELKEILEKYRFEYSLLNKEYIEKKRNNLRCEESIDISNKYGLEYLDNNYIEEILKKCNSYDLNRQICKVISEKEKDAFICGNIDYTISMIDIKPFNDKNVPIGKRNLNYINNELEVFRNETNSKVKDMYFLEKELNINKVIEKFLPKNSDK